MGLLKSKISYYFKCQPQIAQKNILRFRLMNFAARSKIENANKRLHKNTIIYHMQFQGGRINEKIRFCKPKYLHSTLNKAFVGFFLSKTIII